MMENIHIIGSEVVGGKETGTHGVYSLEDLCYVNNFAPIKKVTAPLYHTRTGNYTHTRTYDNTKEALSTIGFIQLDSGLIVNVGQIKEIQKTRFGCLIAYFGDDVAPVEIAANKEKIGMIKMLIKET